MNELKGKWQLVNKLIDKFNYKVYYQFKDGNEITISGIIAKVKIASVTGTWEIKNNYLQIYYNNINLLPADKIVPPLPYDATKDFKSIYALNKFITSIFFNSMGGYKYKVKFENNNKIFLKPLNLMQQIRGKIELDKVI